jgi:hypothetical protein
MDAFSFGVSAAGYPQGEAISTEIYLAILAKIGRPRQPGAGVVCMWRVRPLAFAATGQGQAILKAQGPHGTVPGGIVGGSGLEADPGFSISVSSNGRPYVHPTHSHVLPARCAHDRNCGGADL